MAWSALTRVRTWVVAGVVLLAAAGIFALEKNRRVEEWPDVFFPPRAGVKSADKTIAEAKITVDARSKEKWQYVRFSGGGVVRIAGTVLPDWDVAFRRFQVVTNSGATNSAGQAGARDMGPVAFETIGEAPAEGYLKDVMAGDRVETENSAIKRWYGYDYFTHRLKPKPNVYVVRTADGRFAKFQILSYYGPRKEAGWITIRFAVAPAGSRRFGESHSRAS
ncbi:MAG: HmuY family protein [Nitrospirae bacterium]|nr:HmuY family protein [Nitrospirota bacterium]